MQNRNEEVVFYRDDPEIQNWGRFDVIPETFDRQYCDLYKIRLNVLKQRLVETVQSAWGTRHPILSIVDLAKNESDNLEEKCIIIGTLYKHQEFKPSVLKEICEELQLPTQPRNLINYSSDTDCLFLEDDTQRIKLTGNLSVKEVVTGIVCAVIGHDLKNGTFWVDNWCFPGCYSALHKPINNGSKDEGIILLVSGLNFENDVNSQSLNLLQEWIIGMAGNKTEQQRTSKLIVLIIAGNSIRNKIGTFDREGYFEKNSFNLNTIRDITLFIKKFDDFLSQILENCHVILMPGEFDPSSHLIPQRAFHPQILPKSARFTSLHAFSNPWVGKIKSRIVAGSSGQPIADIMKTSDSNNSAIDWLEKTLMWQHYAPTSPDTLTVYPYYKCDPFIMQECPDIYFTSNMEKFETKLLTGNSGQRTRLICIPQFSKTQTAVLVDLHTLNTSTISFGINS